MRAMGYTAADLKLLHYASYPDLPVLDSAAGGEAGGEAGCKLAHARGAGLVVVETTPLTIGRADDHPPPLPDLDTPTLRPLKPRGPPPPPPGTEGPTPPPA